MSVPVQLLTHEYPPFRGGIGMYVRETARALAKTGTEVTVWAPDYGTGDTGRDSFRVKRVPMRGKQGWPCRLRMAAALRKAFPEGRIPGRVILAEPGPLRMWLHASLLKLPRPEGLIPVLHGTEIGQIGRRPLERRLFRALVGHAEKVGVVSKAVRSRLLEVAPEAEPLAELVPGAVRSAWLDLPAPEPSRESGETFEILQVGRISPRKGQLHLLETIARLPGTRRRQIHLRIIGPAGKAAYAGLVARRAGNLDCRVSLEGSVSDEALREMYRTARLLVMPSQPFRRSVEGLGLALLEAGHFGCPVIASGIGGIPEAMLPGESGYLVPPQDRGALAEAIIRVMDNPEKAARMGAKGAAFVREAFSWEANARVLLGMKAPGLG
ncbi:MAG: glycosyltransferase family 4 protein [Oceanipulchritudo sp.]